MTFDNVVHYLHPPSFPPKVPVEMPQLPKLLNHDQQPNLLPKTLWIPTITIPQKQDTLSENNGAMRTNVRSASV